MIKLKCCIDCEPKTMFQSSTKTVPFLVKKTDKQPTEGAQAQASADISIRMTTGSTTELEAITVSARIPDAD